jgi:two-component system response regulator CssR
MLEYFLENINVPLGREDILTRVWGKNYFGSDRVVDDLLRRLRQKMPKLKIETIYGFGYRLL